MTRKGEEIVSGRYDKSLDRANVRGIAFNQMSANFAMLAVRSAFLLNGAALFALPPVLIGFSNNGDSVAASSLYWPAAYFVFGVVASGVCSFVAYINYQIIAESSDNLQRLEYVKWHSDHMPEYYEANKKHFEETKSINLPKLTSANKWASITAWIGVIFAAASFGCFFRGCQLAGDVLLAIK